MSRLARTLAGSDIPLMDEGLIAQPISRAASRYHSASAGGM
jgi:hypothetical protein